MAVIATMSRCHWRDKKKALSMNNFICKFRYQDLPCLWNIKDGVNIVSVYCFFNGSYNGSQSLYFHPPICMKIHVHKKRMRSIESDIFFKYPIRNVHKLR